LTIFRQLHDPAGRAFTYLIADGGSRDAVAVDAGPEGTLLPLLGIVGELDLRLVALLCTHVHPGAAEPIERIRERTNARIVAGTAAPIAADRRVGHNDTVRFGSEVIGVLETPGHTPASLSFHWRDRVLTGDALLIRGCGRTDLPGGDAGALFDSITRRLLTLPGETLLFPGHETHHRTVSTIAEERDHNPCVAGRSRDEFITMRCA
jgi:sulfur dioxygenase